MMSHILIQPEYHATALKYAIFKQVNVDGIK